MFLAKAVDIPDEVVEGALGGQEDGQHDTEADGRGFVEAQEIADPEDQQCCRFGRQANAVARRALVPKEDESSHGGEGGHGDGNRVEDPC